jgi:hypothetical protein
LHPAVPARQLKGDRRLLNRNRPQGSGEICDAFPKRPAVGAGREMCLEEQVLELREFGVHAQG